MYEDHSINKRNFGEKTKMNLFFRIFFHKYKHDIVWNWFIAKIISIMQKYLFWGDSKGSKLMTEKSKTWEIYRRMFGVYREACFSQINVYKLAKWFCYYEPNLKLTDTLVMKKFWVQQSPWFGFVS